MRLLPQIVGFTVLLALIGHFGTSARAEAIPFTLEDRDRLIRIEATLKEFKDSVDHRFEQVDKRFEQIDRRFEQVDKRFGDVVNFMWLLGSVLGGLVAVTIGFAVWDRRTALAPAVGLL